MLVAAPLKKRANVDRSYCVGLEIVIVGNVSGYLNDLILFVVKQESEVVSSFLFLVKFSIR